MKLLIGGLIALFVVLQVRLWFGDFSPVGADGPGAESDLRHFEVGIAEGAIFHVGSFLVVVVSSRHGLE